MAAMVSVSVADLVQFDKDRVRRFLFYAPLEAFDVGDIKIVADELHLVADLLSNQVPALPVVLK